ncbi:5-oxoprolinase subunit C family protein [Ureibacillus manganicus]|uniref:Allophanate hydrolase n=1 Tax=Ureibacillus manganicus DSM 26584 TaxID=1384049 RepID=A0A0A3IN03_9BACL|nr:biotin-dependent carboxyltransferase family protein [Ureibacillus manganicus]KGR76217.1 allophanate hydrolase [Ureibacillus manganicus DSM 26584]
MKPLLKIIRQGVYTSLQDSGRFGYRAIGIPVSGVMDRYSFEMGNKILNNAPNTVCLEIFNGGFEAEALSDHTYVITGADGDFFINDVQLYGWKSFSLCKGDRLKIKGSHNGSIFYVIPQGGVATESILQSRSTYPFARIGEEITQGRTLYGHELEQTQFVRGLMPIHRPRFDYIVQVRIFKGPHFDHFTPASRDRLSHSTFQYTGGNRMGYFFKGEKLNLIENREIISEATQFGTIQVPPNGNPIVLMADAQTVGGYPIIGTVHEDDLFKVAQLRTFNKIQFRLMED